MITVLCGQREWENVGFRERERWGKWEIQRMWRLGRKERGGANEWEIHRMWGLGREREVGQMGNSHNYKTTNNFVSRANFLLVKNF